MRLVDDDGEGSPAMLVADLVEDEWELLHRGDDDLLALLQERPQLLGPFGHRADNGGHLRELFDGVTDLLVEHAAVGDHDDGVEGGLAAGLQADQLVTKPGNRVALARTCRVLDEIPPPGTRGLGILQQLAYHIELVKAWEDLLRRLFLSPLVRFLDYLSVVL